MIEPEYDYVDLVFENLNYVTITPEYISYMNIHDISEDRYIDISSQYVISKFCKYFEIELKNPAINLKTWFQLEHGVEETFADHLNIFKDITHIEIKGKNTNHVEVKDKNGEIYIAVPWDEKDDSKNRLQKVDYRADSFRIIISE